MSPGNVKKPSVSAHVFGGAEGKHPLRIRIYIKVDYSSLVLWYRTLLAAQRHKTMFQNCLKG